MGSVTSREPFANQKALQDYADAHDLAYVWEGMSAFAKRAWPALLDMHIATFDPPEILQALAECSIGHSDFS
jgi:hypothetical protein